MRVVAVVVLASCWTKPEATTAKPPRVECEVVADHLVELMPDVQRRQLIAALRGGAEVGNLDAGVSESVGRIETTVTGHDEEEARRAREIIANTDKIEITLSSTSMRDTLVDRCVTDRWAAAARQCLTTTESLWGNCAALLTATQRAAIVERLDDR